MIHHAIDQNSEEWLALRLGKFTASTFADLFSKSDGKTYQNAIIKVAYERVTGECQEGFSNKWMDRGHELEPFAVENYERFTFNNCEPAGFFEYDEFTGASPDRKIIGANGGCEFKCPSFQVYNEFLETKRIPRTYFWQIHGQLLCTGWDFIDYMPYCSAKLKQHCITVERDEKILDQLREQLSASIAEVKSLIEKIKS